MAEIFSGDHVELTLIAARDGEERGCNLAYVTIEPVGRCLVLGGPPGLGGGHCKDVYRKLSIQIPRRKYIHQGGEGSF
ncbi:hypothetical protein PM082_023443 [Marasmius tenuissimus]|nr:hypothetical protein PM082_023443 [Marasmius tenuissimus]